MPPTGAAAPVSVSHAPVTSSRPTATIISPPIRMIHLLPPQKPTARAILVNARPATTNGNPEPERVHEAEQPAAQRGALVEAQVDHHTESR